MTILEFILRWLAVSNQQIPNVKEVLVAARDRLPDLAPQLDPIIAVLDQPLGDQGLADLVGTLPPEVLNILRLKLDPRKHAGDAI